MCKPSCCPGNPSSGLGAAIAALVGVAVISAMARPVIHAAEVLLQIVVITLTVLAALAILTVITVLVIRFRRRTGRIAVLPSVRTHLGQAPEITALASGHGTSAVLYSKVQAALDEGHHIVIIDSKKIRTWS